MSEIELFVLIRSGVEGRALLCPCTTTKEQNPAEMLQEVAQAPSVRDFTAGHLNP